MGHEGSSEVADFLFKVILPAKQVLWPRSKTRRVSINNFGFGGSNAHSILEQAPKIDFFSPKDAVITERAHYQQRIPEMIIPPAELGKSRRLCILSASSEASVKGSNGDIHLLFGSLALKLQRRSLFQWRIAISATFQAGTFEALDENGVVPVRSTREPRIGFVFTGQGAQWYDFLTR